MDVASFLKTCLPVNDVRRGIIFIPDDVFHEDDVFVVQHAATERTDVKNCITVEKINSIPT